MKEDVSPGSAAFRDDVPDGFYFDLESARDLLPWLKLKLRKLQELGSEGKSAMDSFDLENAEQITNSIHDILDEIHSRKIEIKDPDAQLFDFPAVINSIPAYICWKAGEEDISYWHYTDEGFAGRKRFTGKENVMSYL